MFVPGGNLLNTALGIVNPTPGVQWLAYTGDVKNAVGVMQPTYAAPVPVRGSMQPLSGARIVQLGLTLGANLAMLYAIGGHAELTRDNASDRFTFDGRLWEIKDRANWTPLDGWDGLLLEDIGPAPDA